MIRPVTLTLFRFSAAIAAIALSSILASGARGQTVEVDQVTTLVTDSTSTGPAAYGVSVTINADATPDVVTVTIPASNAATPQRRKRKHLHPPEGR
jgi:hypothetical protein